MRNTNANAKTGKSVEALTDAQRQLVEQYYDYAMTLGKKFAMAYYQMHNLEDLQQEACYGLCVAAQRFDATRDVAFKTYAYEWCRKYIMEFIHRVPRVDYCDMDALGDLFDDELEALEAEYNRLLNTLLSQLTETERRVITLVYGMAGEPRSLAEVAELLQLDYGYVVVVYGHAMTKLESLWQNFWDATTSLHSL